VTSANVSVDLDPVRCYGAIHGTAGEASPPPADDPIYRHAIPRFRALFDAKRIRATFFVVARDLVDPGYARTIRALAEDGHEIANHSLDHPYDLVRLGPAAMTAQVEGGARAIEQALGRRPAGFRAPGYTVTDELFEVLAACGVRYDASVFPCPAYFAAKVGALALLSAAGRRSASILGSPAVLTAPVEPYRVGRPYTTRGSGLLEIPIGVTAGARLPFLGTALVLAGPRGARAIAAGMRARRFASLELHGIDLSDARADGLGALARRQMDLRVGLARKTAALEAAIDRLAADGRRFLRLDELDDL
jgi:hypothetical protein